MEPRAGRKRRDTYLTWTNISIIRRPTLRQTGNMLLLLLPLEVSRDLVLLIPVPIIH